MNAEERKERSAKLGQAIETYLEGQGFDGMLGDWLLVGSVVKVDPNGEADCEYFVALAGGSMLQHQAVGMLAKAQDVLDDPDE